MNRTEWKAASEATLKVCGVDPFLQGILTDADRLRLGDDRSSGQNVRELRRIWEVECKRSISNVSPNARASGAVIRYKGGAYVTGRV